ncbi:MAG TPA: ABC transporter transmembrane domain-containing protein [Stellaceae bacterium]|nr:ABC transporter transmembrane domain-containing protein [Stellaceae bacterium]
MLFRSAAPKALLDTASKRRDRWWMPPWLPETSGDSLEPSVYRFILRYSLRDQIYLVVVTLISFPFLYYSLDLPKLIINQAIGGKHFPVEVYGLSLGQIPYLLLLSSVFLALVLINGWFKLHLNVRKGRVGERMLRRLRYELFQRVLRFPMHYFDRTATGQIIAMLTAEVEPVGGFIGDALALPIAQAGTLLTIFIFMFVQNPILGAAAVSLYPVQAYFIPKMQRKIRQLGRERVRKIRTLSDRVGETIAAQIEIRTNAGARHQLADISQRLGEIYDIRFDVYNRKFFVKFINNLLNQVTPFLFYLIGGIFVISGELSFGALVAVLAAFKDLSSPWKELLDFYQNQQDVAIKYEQVVEQFQVADMLDMHLLLDEPEQEPPSDGEIVVANVSLVDSDGIRLLDSVSFDVPLGEHAALLGPSSSGKNIVLQLLARIYIPTSGRVTLAGIDLNNVPFATTGRLIGYVGPTTHLFSASIRDNLLVGLRVRPSPSGQTKGDAANAEAVEEARQSGNTELDVGADWVDYVQAGVADAAELETRIVEVARLVDFSADLYLFGLHGRLDPELHPHAATQLLVARLRLEERLESMGIARFVERFDSQRYNVNASVAENLLFGTPIGPAFEGDGLADNPYVQRLLERTGLTGDLLQVGQKLARMMVELFGDLAPEHGFAEEFGFIATDEMHEFERIQARAQRNGVEALSHHDRVRLLGLAFKLVAARDRLGVIDAAMQERIVEARAVFAEELPGELRSAVEFFDPERYNAAARVEENILFGTVIIGEADARERVEAVIGEVLDELELRDTVLTIGLDYAVGTGGSRLSPAQRQKVAIARAILKRPILLALDEATAVLDPAAESHILSALCQEFKGRTIIAALSRPAAARDFAHVLVLDQGRLVSEGDYKSVAGADGPLAPLMAAA